jgi:feruloyl esterase
MDSISYVERVVALRAERRGLPAEAARSEAASFHRLFLVPGMEHCRGGPGPDSFDALPDLVRWVEDGVAPERIVASRVEGGRTAFTRPLCAWPQQARYRGQGDPNDAASFECVPGPVRDLPQLGSDYLR